MEQGRTPSANELRVAVVGPGAMGTLFAARLALAGAPTLLLDHRPDRAASLNERGLLLLDERGEHLVYPTVSANPQLLADIDVALVLVKAYQTEEAAAVLADHLPADSTVATLQNGLGNVETLSVHLGPDRIFGGTTTQGALLVEPGVVRDTGSGPTILGRPDGQSDHRLDEFVQALLLASFAVSISRDLPAVLWTKAILNAAINPTAALTRLPNGRLAEHEPSLRLMTAAAREAFAIARRKRIRVEEQDWRARLQTVCAATATNINSMLQDVLHNRRTEIDAINGAIVRAAETLNMPAPVNQTLWHLIKTLEESCGEQASE
ncbi:MAG: ketopantoate reductase family protein [Armatimonadota bacterium]